MPRSQASKNKQVITEELQKSEYIDNLVRGIIEISRHDPEILKGLTKKQFKSKVVIKGTLPISYTELKKRAMYELEQIGHCFPSSKIYGEGTYIIVGDVHGKHTRTGMFKLLETLNSHLSADRIIHVGHYLDDDNDQNYNCDNFKNLTIIAKEEELKTIASKKLNHEIIRKEIILGNGLSIVNQDLISDYVSVPLSSSIKPDFFPLSTITNLHRHEFDTRCTASDKFSCVASPGCLCEQHIIKTIKQMDFTNGLQVKQSYPSGFSKYRKMQHTFKLWQQGAVVVHIDKKGDFSIILCRIHKTSKGFTTSYFDKIITETEILDPDEKSFINTDLHSDLHDTKILDIQDQIVKDYKPDNYICLGDINSNESINHYRFSQYNSMRIEKSLLNESAATHFLLDQMCKWARRRILLIGNHERFLSDLSDKLPQLKELLDFKYITGLQDINVEVIDLKKIKTISNMNLIHGDLKMFGQKGGLYLDKVFRTYGRNTVVGHTHYASCRNDCYTVPLTGKLDLNYNEVEASKWVQGGMLANSFENVSFLSNICIVNYKTLLNRKTYLTKNSKNWEVPKFRSKIVYEQI